MYFIIEKNNLFHVYYYEALMKSFRSKNEADIFIKNKMMFMYLWSDY